MNPVSRLATCLLVLLSSCHGGAPSPAPLEVTSDVPIILIVIDALRADRVHGERGRAIAPRLAALARDSVVFSNAFASAPKTMPSVPQIFTSRYFPDIDHAQTLLTVLAEAYYDRTGAFIHNPYVTKWLARLEPTFDDLGGGAFDAVRLTDDAAAWLEARTSQRFALYMHYLDVHVPLRPPAEVASRFVDTSYRGPIGLEFDDLPGAWAGRYNPEDQRRVRQIYDATVAATDAQVGRLLDFLRRRGLYEHALIVVTADHGEELWDHGGFFHGHTLHDELLRVPLIVKFPGQWAAGTEVTALARSIDILPTIVDLLSRSGVSIASDCEGDSLIPLVGGQSRPRTLFATVGRVDERSPPLLAVRTASAKLIHDVRSGDEQLFDLAADPGENSDLARSEPAPAALGPLRTELAARMERLHSTGVHLRLASSQAEPARYHLEVSLAPIVPFINFARFGLEDGDRIEPKPRADGFRASGVLAPGDTDEIRFDVLSTSATLKVALTTEPAGLPVEVCVGEEKDCATRTADHLELALERLDSEVEPPPRKASSIAMSLWRLPGQTPPITNLLSPADRERLRALGYAE